MLRRTVFIPLGVLLLCLAACQSPDATAARDDAASLQFSGERAFAIETEFVESFPYRDSGQPNNRLAAEWVAAQLIQLEFTCRLDEWDIINFSQPVHLNNVICQLPGKSGREIVLMAHHDQSPATIYGADNDGSGIAIMLHLAELLAAEEKPNYTLTIVSTDAEEFGMIGSQRFVETHPDISNIIAGISLDNLGKALYTGVNMSGIGQFAGNAPLWLLLTARDAAANAGNIWVPEVRAPIDQVLDQAVPISFMDQGPMVAAGIPALGFAGRAPAEAAELHWQTYHTPDDTLEYQSPDTLHHTGRVAEALLRQLMSQDTFPDESGPFLYLAASDRVLRGWPLWLIFITTTAPVWSWRCLLWQRFRSPAPGRNAPGTTPFRHPVVPLVGRCIAALFAGCCRADGRIPCLPGIGQRSCPLQSTLAGGHHLPPWSGHLLLPELALVAPARSATAHIQPTQEPGNVGDFPGWLLSVIPQPLLTALPLAALLLVWNCRPHGEWPDR